jgi:hypothetical protein
VSLICQLRVSKRHIILVYLANAKGILKKERVYYVTIMEEKMIMILMQEMYTEASLESLAESLLDKKQFETFQARKFDLVEEKLKGMTDQIEKWKREFE